MKSNKFLLGALVGGAVFFLLGWLVYGKLLADTMKSPIPGVDRGEENIVLWAMIVGHLFLGLLLSYVIGKSPTASAGSGAAAGFLVGLFVSTSYDFIIYGVSNLYDSIKTVLIDIAVFTVLAAITGAVVGWIYGMGKKAAP